MRVCCARFSASSVKNVVLSIRARFDYTKVGGFASACRQPAECRLLLAASAAAERLEWAFFGWHQRRMAAKCKRKIISTAADTNTLCTCVTERASFRLACKMRVPKIVYGFKMQCDYAVDTL